MDKASEFLNILEEDVEAALANCNSNDTAYNRRTFVRTFYAFLEGVIHCLRVDIVKRAEQEPGTLTTAEMAVLREESYCVDGRYSVRTRVNNFLKFDQAFRLAFKYYFPNEVIDYGDGGWECLIKGLDVRNRITHPKSLDQIQVADSELITIKRAKEWSVGLLAALLVKKSG